MCKSVSKITVNAAAESALCLSCGICRNVCPVRCIEYTRKHGMYYPLIDEERCIKCGMCSDVCPGLSVDYSNNASPVTLAEAVEGENIGAFTAWSRDADLRHTGASGGTVMTIVRHLLNLGEFDCAFCVTDYGCSNQIKTEAVKAQDLEKLAKSSKSRYVPVSHENLVKYVLENRESRVIVVGVSCAVSGFLKVIERFKLNRDNYLIIGLFCEGVFTYNIFDYYASPKFCGEKKLSALNFKNKESGGWPGDMKLFYDDGTWKYFSSKERTSMKRYFRSERCMYCIDKLNVQSDISCGDNYTGENSSSLGSNSVVVRTERGKRCFDICREQLEVIPVDYGKILKAQDVYSRAENYFSAENKKSGINSGISDTNGFSYRDVSSDLKRLSASKEYAEYPEFLEKRVKRDAHAERLHALFNVPRRAMSKLKRLLLNRIIAGILALLLAIVIIIILVSRFSLKVTSLTFESPKVDGEFKVVQLTDLHGRSFGKDNSALIEKIDKISPDAVFMTGDMIGEKGNFDEAEKLIGALSERYDVYFSIGNHETESVTDYGAGFVDRVKKAGGVLLEKEYTDCEINGNKVRIGGVSGYALGVNFWERSYLKKADDYFFTDEFAEQRFMLDFEDTDVLKLLLLHRPEAATLWNGGEWFDVDFVFSGHTHGGVIRLPFVGGLYAPEEAFFPDYDYGMFDIGGVRTYISSGLDGVGIIPRFNNRPEIVSVTFKPEQH